MKQRSPMVQPSAHVDTFVLDGLPPIEDWPVLLPAPRPYPLPDRLNVATVLLDDAVARGWGDRPCVRDPDHSWTYAELLEQANRMAHVLVDHGIVPGNRVLLRGGNAAWLVAAWFAVLKAGGVAVTTMPLLREPELKKIIDKCRPSIALCHERVAAPLEAVAGDMPVLRWGGADDPADRCASAPSTFDNVDTAATDPALLGFTSGTTGAPKATIHFHRDLLVVTDAFLPTLAATAEDVFCGSPPLGFTFGLGGLVVLPMRVGASTIHGGVQGPEALAELIAQHRPTVVFTAPTAYRRMLRIPDRDLSSLRRGVSGGETLSRQTFLDFEAETGVRLIDGLGSTELLHIFVCSADEDIRVGATGKPLPGYVAAVLDAEGREVPNGTVGRLAIRGPVGCRYLDDERQKSYVQNGWNMTGDAYLRDDDGYLHYQARTDDMIVSSGYNIAAPDVEEALMTHPDVLDAGVVGVADDTRGTVVKAFVQLVADRPSGEDMVAALQSHVKTTIAPYKYPRLIEFTDAPLPRTESGKLRRVELRSR